MAKNLIPQIAKMLGVEIGEEFKIKGADTDYNEYTYFFADSGLKVKFDKHPDVIPSTAFATVPDLLNGDAEVIKMPWKPKKGETYYTFELLGGKWVVRSLWWTGSPDGHALLGKGWVYKTCAEAEAALPTVAKEVGAEYELSTSDTEAVEQWKPKEGEDYYSFCRFLGEWCVWQQQWSNHPFDLALLEKGWIYRSQAEAEAVLPKVAAEIGVEYKL
jgi:hypothetical protein